MQAIIYLMQRQFINRIKRMFLSPLSIILTILVAFGFTASIVSAIMMEKPAVDSATAETLIAGSVLLIGVLMYYSFLSRDSGILTMADANFLFTGPFEKRTVLAYILISTAPASVFTGLFMCFYLPFLLGPALTIAKFIVAIFTISLLFGCIYLSYYYLYIIDSEKPGIKKKFRTAFLVFLGVLLIAFVILLFNNDFNVRLTAKEFFTHSLYNWFPLFGWAKWAISSILTGNILVGFLPATVLLVIANVLLGIALYNVKVDFYEKTLEDSANLQKIMDEVKNSGSADARAMLKIKNNAASVNFMQGAAAIYSRHMLESKKFGIFSNYREVLMGLFYVAFGAIFGLEFSFVIAMIGFGALSMSLNDSWHRDFKKPYIYLIPASSFQKVIFSVLPGVKKTLISGCISISVAAIVYKISPVELLSYLLIYASFVFLFIFAEVLTYRIIGPGSNAMVIMFMRMFFAIATCIPAIVVLVVIMVLTTGSVNLLALAACLFAINIASSSLLAFLSREIFEKSEIME